VLTVLLIVGAWQFSVHSAPQTHRSFYENGVKSAEWSEDAEGRYHGQMIRYHRTGEVLSISDYNHGETGGSGIEYDVHGNVVRSW
jgi:antitoxin component YwqK of YwqJK toxin-antitoxin module